MWCDLNEAFGEGNNTFKKGWKHFISKEDDSTINSQSKNNDILSHKNYNLKNNNQLWSPNEYMTDNQNYYKYSNIDNFSNVSIQDSNNPIDEDIKNTNEIFQSNPYFSAQGDLHNQNNNISSFSIPSIPSSPLLNNSDKNDDDNIIKNDIPKKINKKVNFTNEIRQNDFNDPEYDHEYYINAFINILLKNDSKSSETNSDIYDHIKKCKFCREKVKQLLISHQNNISINNHTNSTNFDNQKNINNLNNYNNSEQEMYNSNGIELMILIIMGIIIMLIIDMIFKLE